MSTQRLAQSRLAPVGPAGASSEVVPVAPSAISLDDTDTPCDVVDALILAAFADGRQPCARTARVHEVRPGRRCHGCST